MYTFKYKFYKKILRWGGFLFKRGGGYFPKLTLKVCPAALLIT
jgi:hypothetical protein